MLLLKVVIALALCGSLFVQVVMLPLLWIDLTEVGDAALAARIAAVAIIGLGVFCMQVFGVCVWRLLTLVGRSSVFSPVSYRYVDVITIAIGAASALTFAFAFLLAPGGIAPGIVALICGGALFLAGVTLLVRVLRHLLTQAIVRDSEAKSLRAELDEVI